MTRAILSHADYSGVPRESAAREDAVCLRRDGRVRDRGLAGAPEQERPRPRAGIGHQADEGQGVRPRASSARTCAPAPSCWAAARNAHRQRDYLHAASRRTRSGSEELCRLAYAPNAERRTAVYPPEMSERPPVVTLEGVTVLYGAQRALHDVTARFEAGAVGLLGPERRRQEHDDQGAARFHQAGGGHDARARLRRRGLAAGHPRPRRVHARERRAHSRDERRVVRGVLRRAGRPAARRRDAAGPRSAVLRRPRRGQVPQRGDLLHRHEAAHQAGPGARARSRPAVSRRADQRHGSEGPRRDARARPRSGPPQERQRHRLVAPAARRRIHVRRRRRHGQGPRRHRRDRSPP